ncbi:BZ3500_MvSof-1268-A1-R1_Chr2-1g04619 [Microbotryum saponariae]|uniref:BZ3500_MvSof-1268-A1-R1_Chr2-1g04619 protein n=1 Tax=Microbotryum saponariae TaxID=289078 RepID=A0A2X0KG30_9BASI|nr:BZ3500_MvSof-1268-A1-R1_Chr2-1g04619 [Microbotryum saponariae]SCZ92139.1 BZ3501_MvSof-1269-A2-R1_Chr2-1g04275 [Microbotryum saponariae]
MDLNVSEFTTKPTRDHNDPAQRSHKCTSPCPVCDEGKNCQADQCPDAERRNKYLELKSDFKNKKSVTQAPASEQLPAFAAIPNPAESPRPAKNFLIGFGRTAV